MFKIDIIVFRNEIFNSYRFKNIIIIDKIVI